jgi:pyruvate/2-oxoacid:ferredoxin oxidoreductase beta subunit/Pyruvate/2-oxoacid:ferredoxin oxidoreductase gamma subunit
MNTVLNSNRPLFFCPGCSHERVVHGVDRAIQSLGLQGHQVAIVSDIGCSGLFDTFFNTHALHGLHGRALTYATGLKMVRPELTVLVIMGDGGLGIGGAHVLASCRRNLDITLLVLNNFNYGMTGGQCSTTTPCSDQTASNFLNKLEVPIDICRVAEAAGALFTEKVMSTDGALAETISRSIEFPGFALLDIWGICPGRHLKKNPITPGQLEQKMRISGGGHSVHIKQDKDITGEYTESIVREEYGAHYRRLAAVTKDPQPLVEIESKFNPLIHERTEVVILGAAGQFINTVGEILSIGAMSSGLWGSQKNDYPITVLRGHSISEVVIDTKPITYTGIDKPAVIICVGQEGVDRRKKMFAEVDANTVIIAFPDLRLPATAARVIMCDGSKLKLKKGQRGIAALAVLVQTGLILDCDMLNNAIKTRYSGMMADVSLEVIATVITSSSLTKIS